MGYYDQKMNDWRGIAMLTQQMSQLFEPSKARLMSRQQEHEMNMMLAKKAWEMQSEDINVKKTKYENINKEIEKYSLDLQGKNLKDLVAAGTKDGATPDESVTVLEKTALKRLDEMQDIASQYHTMIMEKQKVLDNFVRYDTEVKLGEKFAKSYKSAPTSKKQVDYYTEAEKDKIPGMSYAEGQQALNRFLHDTYQLEEGEEGMEVTVGKNIEGKDDVFRIKPEGVAFMAGYNSTQERDALETGQATAVAKASKKIYEKSYPNTSNRELKQRYINNMNTISGLNTKHKNQNKLSIGMYLDVSEGVYTAKDLSQLMKMYDANDINKYIAARTIIDRDVLHLNSRGLSIDVDNMVTLEMDGMTVTDSMIEDFSYISHPGTNDPNQMYNKILSSSDKKGYEEKLEMYKEFINRFDTIDRENRLIYIDKFNKWLAE